MKRKTIIKILVITMLLTLILLFFLKDFNFRQQSQKESLKTYSNPEVPLIFEYDDSKWSVDLKPIDKSTQKLLVIQNNVNPFKVRILFDKEKVECPNGQGVSVTGAQICENWIYSVLPEDVSVLNELNGVKIARIKNGKLEEYENTTTFTDDSNIVVGAFYQSIDKSEYLLDDGFEVSKIKYISISYGVDLYSEVNLSEKEKLINQADEIIKTLAIK